VTVRMQYSEQLKKSQISHFKQKE